MAPDDVVSQLRTLTGQLPVEHHSLIEHAVALIEKMGLQVETLRKLAAAPYRRKSEKMPPGQLALDLIGYLLSQAECTADVSDGVAAGLIPAAVVDNPPRAKRKSKIKLLPVQSADKTLDEHERRCHHCNDVKTPMGVDVRRHVMFEPAKVYMLEERLHKYACRGCREGVVTAAGTPKIIEGGLASSSLLAHLVVSKVVDATPVERVGKQLARHGADLAPSTLHEWFGRVGELCAFLRRHALEALRVSYLVSLDDTPLLAKNKDRANGMQRGRLWLYIGDISRVAYCEYTPDWKGSHPCRVLDDYNGRIQNDGYGGTNPLFGNKDGPLRVGCNDHARRRFVDALKQGDTRAQQVVDLYKLLYAVERHAAMAQLKPPDRLALRQEKSLPLWAELEKRIGQLERDVEPKGTLGRGVHYWRKQNPTLRAFLEDGLLPISNAHVERYLRTVALLRKNSLYVGSVEAGERYAVLLTLALNCLLCGANPFEYFTDLFDSIAAGWPASRGAELLPRAWLDAKEQAAQQAVA